MAHHEQNVALLQVVKGCTFWKNTPDKLVCDFTAALLVGTLGIAIKDPAAHLSKLGTLNGERVGKLTASVRENYWKQSAKSFKNLFTSTTLTIYGYVTLPSI